MDNKIIAIIVVALLAIGGVVTYVVVNGGDKGGSTDVTYDASAYNLIARVNSEGSGLFIESELLQDGKMIPTRAINGVPFYADDFTISKENKAAWGGLVFSDPGPNSIQHTQLIAIANELGLEPAQYQYGQTTDVNKLYYFTGLSNYGMISQNNEIQGGIIWEPQFQRVIQEDSDRFVLLALTNDLFPEHTCCVIASNHNWLVKNEDTAVRFLAGYIEGVDFIVNAVKSGGDDYNKLIEIAKSTTQGLTDDEIKSALNDIEYLYADDDKGQLNKLTSDVSELATELSDLGIIPKAKLKDADKLAKAFVDDKYLKKAVAGVEGQTETKTISVAVITGDIHQLAIHVAIHQEYFKNYGIEISLTPGASGGDVATVLLSNDVQIGFLGAPPATINTVNGEHIKY